MANAIDEIFVQGRSPAVPAAAALRGRGTEVAVIGERLAAVADGRGGVLLIDGRPGIGKTRLLGELQGWAGRTGLQVLSAGAVDGLQRSLFSPLLDALLSAQAPIIDGQAVRDLDHRGDLGYWLVRELRDALERAAARSPLVIVLDDLQWADPGTVTALRTLTTQLRQHAVLWVLAARRGHSPGAVRNLFQHLAASGADVLRPGVLPQTAVVDLVEDVVRAAATPPLLDLVRTAGGHPYWLTELLHGLREDGRLTVARGHATVSGTRIPRRIVTAMRDRLEVLTPQARRALRTAAVLPTRFTAERLADLLREHPADVIESLDEVIRADLLAVEGAAIYFRLELLRQAVRETIPGSLRRVLEREAAEVLLRTGADPTEVAAVLAETAEVGDRTAVATLRSAARTLATSDAATAADLCERAFDLLAPDDPERGPAAAEAIDLMHRAHRVADVARLTDRALAGPLTTQQEAELRLTMSSLIARPPAARLRDNRIALTLYGVSAQVRVRHHGLLAHNLLMAGDHEAAHRLARRTLAEAAEVSDPPTANAARLVLAGTYTARGAGDLASADIDALLGSGPAAMAPQAQHEVLLATLLHCLGRGKEGSAALDDCLRRARRERNEPLLSLATQIRGQVSLTTGRLGEARADVESASAKQDHGIGTVLRMVTMSGLAAHLGDNNLARAAIAAAKELRAGDSSAERAWACRVLAIAAAQRDDLVYACRLLDGVPLLPTSPPMPYDITFLTLAARAAVATQDRTLIDRIADTAVLFGDAAEAAPAFIAAAEHLHGLIDADPVRLLTAADLHNAAGRPLLAAAAAEDAGRIPQHGEGAAADGIERLNRAFDIYTAVGALADAQRVEWLLRARGVRRRVTASRPSTGWASLTPAELKVARLIATGITNRDTAERLRLSPHTVNAQIRNAFTKLGITSRVQLANMLRDHDG